MHGAKLGLEPRFRNRFGVLPPNGNAVIERGQGPCARRPQQDSMASVGMASVGWHRLILSNVLISPESEGPAGRYTLCRRSATAGSRPQLNFLRPAGPTHRDDVSETARTVSPHSGLSRIKGRRTGGRGPPSKDVSAHSGLDHEPVASAISCRSYWLLRTVRASSDGATHEWHCRASLDGATHEWHCMMRYRNNPTLLLLASQAAI